MKPRPWLKLSSTDAEQTPMSRFLEVLETPAARPSAILVLPLSLRLTVFLGLLLNLGCEPSGAGHAKATGETVAFQGETPFLVKSADSLANGGGIGFQISVDPQTGKLQQRLRLSLIYVPSPKPGATNLPACFKPFAANAELGVISCEESAGVSVPLLGGYLEQYCRGSDSETGSLAAAQIQGLLGCKSARATLHEFSPRIRLEVVPQ